MSKIQSGLILILVVIIAIGFAWAGGQNTQQFELLTGFELPLFLIATFFVFFIQWCAFIPAYLNKTEHFYDLIGGMTYLGLAGGMLILNGAYDVRSILLAVLVGVWAFRLSLFLFRRIGQDGSDSRFDSIKLDLMRFLLAWTIQGLWVVVTAGCAVAAISSIHKVPMSLLDSFAIAVWLIGFSIEVIADKQKRLFRRQKNKTSPFIRDGLWRYSRHPNYLGEILLWLGITLLAFPVLTGWQYVTLLSPIFVVFLLTKVSGVPILEAKADERWLGFKEYQHYKQTTPVLIPSLSSIGIRKTRDI